MIISLNWLKKFTDITLPVDELATLIGARLVEIESITDLAPKYKDVVVVRVVTCEPLEGSDHLHVTDIDDGGVWSDVERDDNGHIKVVCGAPNVRAGMLAAWLPPGSTVPETYDDSEPFVLSAKKLRGVTSNGMLASAKELDLFDDHHGIIDIDKELAPGTRFADAYELNDYLLDIENKSLTHRPDTFGIIGFAREIAGIQGIQFTTPSWLHDETVAAPVDTPANTPHITIDDPSLSDRFQAIVLTNADEGAQSPLDIQTYLARSGIRPISAVVDVTNYMMLLAGRPLHAYDYDKVLAVSGGKNDIHVRLGRKDETLALLDGRVLQLDVDDIVIAAGETAIGLGGAMGGRDTEIDSGTKRILLECATFDLYRLRNMQMRHGIFTEAITRLTKGLPGELGAPVLAAAVKMMGELAGAQPASLVGDAYPGKHDKISVSVKVSAVNAILGTSLSAQDVRDRLTNVEFDVTTSDDSVVVDVPYWRNDIHIPEDIVEEVGRLGGFDSITPTLPLRDFTAVRPDTFDQLRTRLRTILVRAGANEVLSYSFVHGDTMKKAGQQQDEAYRIVNSISPDLQYYRQSLTPSVLGFVQPNVKAGYDQFALFELNKFHTKKHPNTDEGVPKELDSLAFVVTSKKGTGSAFYKAKQHLEFIASQLGLSFTYEPLEDDSTYPVTRPYEPKRSARVSDSATGERVGVIGEFTSSVRKSFKLPDYTAGFEISPRALEKLVAQTGHAYRPLSRYPSSERDICLQVSKDTMYSAVEAVVRDSLKTSELLFQVSPVDIYQADDSATKNITMRVTMTARDRTLTSEEVSTVIDNIVHLASETLGASLV